MSVECLSDRLSKLRQMREHLCEKEKNWKEAFAARDWIVDQLNILKKMSEDNTHTKEDIKNRIDDILCVIDPGEEDER
tara:strand:+ start:311 stop:544 length:234 start_codon:yes stop_codon:yes gene_type:complete